MKSFKNTNEITLPFGLAFAQVVIIKLFDLGFLPRLLSFEPGRREFQLLVAPGLYLPQPSLVSSVLCEGMQRSQGLKVLLNLNKSCTGML